MVTLCLSKFTSHFIFGTATENVVWYQMLYVCVADVLRLKAVSIGVVVIKGEATGRYLAMNKNGRLYGSVSIDILQFDKITATIKQNLILNGKTEHLQYQTMTLNLPDMMKLHPFCDYYLRLQSQEPFYPRLFSSNHIILLGLICQYKFRLTNSYNFVIATAIFHNCKTLENHSTRG